MGLLDIEANPIPPGATLDRVTVGAVELRAARWPAPDREGRSRGTVLVCQGRGEFIEKYAEVVADLLARGFGVVAFDWRGQGGSSRLLANARKGHVGHFDSFQEDLDAVRRAVLEPFCPRPWFCLAHSMGGAILMDHAGRGPSVFERIVLSAPMIDIVGLRMPGAVRAMAAAATALGLGRLYVPGGGSRSAMALPFDGNVLTSDSVRYSTFQALVRAAPELTIGAPTHGWLNGAFRCMSRFREPDYARQITTPVLVVAAGADRVVDTRAIERFGSRLKAGRVITIDRARHEVLMEIDALRNLFWAAFDAFVPGTPPATLAGPTGMERNPNRPVPVEPTQLGS